LGRRERTRTEPGNLLLEEFAKDLDKRMNIEKSFIGDMILLPNPKYLEVFDQGYIEKQKEQ
jgi:hypothetical protein